MTRKPPKPSATRVVGYRWERRDEPSNLRQVDHLLDAAVMAGVVTQWDRDGGGRCVWCNGPPGEGMREVKVKVSAILGPTVALSGSSPLD